MVGRRSMEVLGGIFCGMTEPPPPLSFSLCGFGVPSLFFQGVAGAEHIAATIDVYAPTTADGPHHGTPTSGVGAVVEVRHRDTMVRYNNRRVNGTE